MQIAFNKKSLRTVCESQSRAEKELGVLASAELKQGLADMRAAQHAKDFPANAPKLVEGSNGKHMELSLSESHAIVFCANHTENPLDGDDQIDWSKVSRIKILKIREKHG